MRLAEFTQGPQPVQLVHVGQLEVLGLKKETLVPKQRFVSLHASLSYLL
jgi:hypothetical protein